MRCGYASCLVTSLFALSMASVEPAVAASDTTPPQLTAFSFTPSAVDVSTGAQSVIVNATITDDLSGFSSGYVEFLGPNNQYVIGYFSRTFGTTLNGTYRTTVTVPRFVAAGVWKALVYLWDSAGNSSRLAASNLVTLGFPTDLTVTDSSPDTLPPTLLSASFSPSTIDVSSSSVNVTLTLQISDNLSGVCINCNITWFEVAITPPTTTGATAVEYISNWDFHLVAGTATSGTWQAVKAMPRYSPAGSWQIQYITLYDAVTNYISLNTAQLQAAGINPILFVKSTPSDIAQPTLTGLTFSPPLFNTSTGSQNVTITMSASDNLSGVDFTPTTSNLAWIQIDFYSPSGNQFVYVSPFTAPTIVGGTPLAGTWQMAATWPQFSEEGTWQASYFAVKDAVGNQINYTPAMLQSMGFPNSIVVTKPSLIPDGTVGPGGGTVTDNSFGSRASITFPPGILTTNTTVAIDVFANPLPVPTPRGFTVPGTYFENLSFSPALASPIPAPGITLVLPLLTPMTPGAHLSLYHIDPVSGTLAPAMNAFHNFVVGTVNGDGLSATFLNVVTLSTVAAYLSTGSVLGDIDGSGTVNCTDMSLLKASFGRRTGQSGFNSAADLNNDGVVDVKDLIIITRQLPAGTTCQ